MIIEELSIRDPRVQEFLWKYLEPQDFRHDYTKIDAIKYVEQQCYEGTCRLFGNMDQEFMFRCTQRNAKVVEPHIMGNGKVLRTAIADGLSVAWRLGYERIVIWTHHKRIARIAHRVGFDLHGVIPKVHLVDGEMTDLYALSIERTKACATLLG